jgi:hypothetical protein
MWRGYALAILIYIWIGVTDIEGENEACGVIARMLLRLIRLL